jgi:L,D-transpeptidase YbiS
MSNNKRKIEISLKQQKLFLYEKKILVEEYAISTALNGSGELIESECTPLGLHRVMEKIGSGAEPGTVFVARVETGEIYNDALKTRFPERDWILTRILRLSGEEKGINKGGKVDTLQRMIYIHGCPDTVKMGTPGSHGCIRMQNMDIVHLYDLIDEGTLVNIYN